MSYLEKIEIIPGVSWVQVSATDLKILCGCPADIVKHLMKKGLILGKEVNGVHFETGPSAILLSDVPLQNGHFCNLAEFPVLQMLYRQGMILPNHPNNTGVKPLLLGISEQLRAQLDYIYRGNYGLVSKEEIMETGIPEAEAEAMMRMKLKFAFGKIHHSDDLLEKLDVGEEYVEIRDEVYVRRLRLNVYEFEYYGETVIVDLNLPSRSGYAPPYQLGFHQIQRDYFAIIHSGEGDGWDDNRPCMASILSFQGKLYLIDAGPNILFSLTSLGIAVNEIEGIFHTHAHDDHFAGLTTLIRSDHRIKYFAPRLVRASVTKKLEALMGIDEKRFADYFEIQDLEFDEWNYIEGLEVKPIFSPHPIETGILLFRTLWENGYLTYGHFADIASLDVLERMITEDETQPGITREMYEQVKANYLVYTDLKKVDIGGGMIHGNAKDFAEDTTDKLVLSHTSFALNESQKLIGSERAFGLIDVLIPANQDYIIQRAATHLQSHFPQVPLSEIQILLNHPIRSFHAGTILLKQGSREPFVYLILTGEVDFILLSRNIHHTLSAGSIIGEEACLQQIPELATCRAASPVQTLRIPAILYREFVRRNHLLEEIEQMAQLRTFLQSTYLFGEMISHPVQTRIAQSMALFPFKEGDTIPTHRGDYLYLLKSGSLVIRSHGMTIETLNTYDFCGEDGGLQEVSEFEVVSETASVTYAIPHILLNGIPIVHWKLLEALQRRIGISSQK